MSFTYDEKYQFTEKWFDPMIPLWEKVFEQHIQVHNNEVKNVLEIGCYEGRATVFLCETFLNNPDIDYQYDIVDTFGGTEIEYGMEQAMSILAKDKNAIENTFKHNISFFNHINFNIHKGFSQKVLPTFDLVPKYDFIYIDASHRADDTFVDAYYANKMLKQGGIMIFDDYGWKDPNNMHESNSPQLGIDVFGKTYEKEYHVVYAGYQVVLRKL